MVSIWPSILNLNSWDSQNSPRTTGPSIFKIYVLGRTFSRVTHFWLFGFLVVELTIMHDYRMASKTYSLWKNGHKITLNTINLKRRMKLAEKMPQWQRVMPDLPEDEGCIPAPTWQLTLSVSSYLGIQCDLLASLGTWPTHCAQTYMQAKHIQ